MATTEQIFDPYFSAATGTQINNAAAKVATMEETLSGTAGTIPSSAAVKNYVDGKLVDTESALSGNAVYDISEANNGTTYANLAAALNNGNNIPASIRKGGISIKFIQSSDNKYVQYRLMAQAFSTTVSDWQGVDDEPIVGSKNLVESGGAFFEIYSVKALSGKLMPTLYYSKDSTPTHEIIYSPSNAYRALIANPIKNNKYNLIGVSTLNQTISCRAYRGTLDDYTYVQDITVTNKTIEIGNIDFDFILVNQKVADSPNFENCHFECMDDFQIDDTTTVGNQPTKLTLSLKKKENNQEGSAYRTLDTITIEEPSDEKAGLMPAKNLWDFIPKKNSNRIVGSGGIYNEIEKNAFKDKIYDATEQAVTLSVLNTELIEGTVYGDDNGDVKTTTNVSYGTLLFDVSAFDYINIINDGNGLHHNFNGGFFDEDKKCLVGFSYLDTAPNDATHIDVPYKAKYFGVTVQLSNIQYFTYNGYICNDPYTLDDLNVKFEQVEGCKKEAVKNTVMLGISNTELIEGTIYANDNGGVKTNTNASYGTLLFDVSAFDYIDISRDPNGLEHSYNGGFFDAQKTCLVGFSNLESTYDVTHINVVPNAKYIGLTVKLSNIRYFSFDGYVAGNLYLKIPNLRVETNQIKSHWYGKKIVWLGTSVPFGQYASESYVKEAADRLGFRLVQTSIPGEAIHGRIDAGTGLIIGAQATPKSGTALTKAEYLAAYNAGLMSTVIADEPIDWVPGGSFNMYYATFENIFTAENADADLYVFDVAPNNTNFDLDDWNAFNKNTFAYNDSSDFSAHRCTFIGALLFLMKKMYDLNPNARCVFVLGCTYNYTEGKAAFEALSTQWKIPIIDLWGKINTCPPSLNVIKSQGGTNWHPSTFAHERMGDMLTNELLLIS